MHIIPVLSGLSMLSAADYILFIPGGGTGRGKPQTKINVLNCELATVWHKYRNALLSIKVRNKTNWWLSGLVQQSTVG